jgi:hypothetical protein
MVMEQLRNNKVQNFICGVTILVGGLLLLSGEASLKLVCMISAFFAVMVLTMGDLALLWPVGICDPICWFAGVEAGLLGAFVVHQGFEASVLVLGAVSGFVFAWDVKRKLVEFGVKDLDENKEYTLALYTAFILIFVLIFLVRKHRRSIALISSSVGGLLIASAACWGITFMRIHQKVDAQQHNATHVAKHDVGAVETPVMEPWIDFLQLLLGALRHDVGIFATEEADGTTWGRDRIFGCALWFLFFVMGTCIQFNNIKNSEAVSARELSGVVEPLLQKRIIVVE